MEEQRSEPGCPARELCREPLFQDTSCLARDPKSLRAAAILVGLLAAACGGGSGSPSQPSSPSNPNTLTITSAGVNPKTLTVSAGARVLFVNSDARPHNMTSDPHPEHDACPELNVGVLNPGQSRESLNLVRVETCGFHDHDNFENNALKGQIVIR